MHLFNAHSVLCIGDIALKYIVKFPTLLELKFSSEDIKHTHKYKNYLTPGTYEGCNKRM